MREDWVDYSNEMNVIRSRWLRWLLKGLAAFFMLVGIIGAFLPLLPTTPFLLLAAACYARSSPRFYNWLMNHPKLGPPLRLWRKRGSISRKNKMIAISMMAITMIPTIVFWVPIVAVKIGLAVVGLSVACYVATRPEA